MLPNTTETNIFAVGIRHLGERGGSRRRRDHGNQRRGTCPAANGNLPSSTNTITAAEPMVFPRRYPRSFRSPPATSCPRRPRGQGPRCPRPHAGSLSARCGWQTLWGAASDAAFGTVAFNWYYPRAFVTPGGRVFVLGHSGETFYLDPAGNGTITQSAQTTLAGQGSSRRSCSLPVRSSVRNGQNVNVVDVNGQQPVITPTANIDQVRLYSNATVLADGKVLVTGGSAVANQLQGWRTPPRSGIRHRPVDAGSQRPEASTLPFDRSAAAGRHDLTVPAARRGR